MKKVISTGKTRCISFDGCIFHNSKFVTNPKHGLSGILWKGLDAFLESEPKAIVIALGEGAGHIAVKVGLNYPESTIIATDINPDAIPVIRKNLELNGVEKAVTVVESDLFQKVRVPHHLGASCVVTFAPPQLPIRLFEPRFPGYFSGRNYVDGDDHLIVAERALVEAKRLLPTGTVLLFAFISLVGIETVMNKYKSLGFSPEIIISQRRTLVSGNELIRKCDQLLSIGGDYFLEETASSPEKSFAAIQSHALQDKPVFMDCVVVRAIV